MGSPAASGLAACLRDLGATHVVALPDNVSAPVLEALSEDGGVRLVSGTREGEIIAMASGLWVGGGSPVVIMQNTGLLESGDALRGTASRMGCPLLILVTCRGYGTVRALGQEPRDVEMSRDTLIRPDLDSVAPMTEATLQAWGIPFLTLSDADDLSPIRAGWVQAHAEERPVAVLVDAHFPPGR